MSLDEFLDEFKKTRVMVKVENQDEKRHVVDFMEHAIECDCPYITPFDPDYPHVGWHIYHLCGYCNPSREYASSISYAEFCAIIEGVEECVDEKSILSLL